jgi:hypothetical protein
MGLAILPQPTSLGAEVGGALGQGIQKGAEQGFQRANVQQALGQLSNLPANATPFDLAKSLISATAGIPGAERYVGTLFPLLLQQMQRKDLLKSADSLEPKAGQDAQGATTGIPGQSRIISQQEMDQIAKNYPGDPNDVYAFLNQRNQAILNEQETYRTALSERIGSTDPADLAVAERMAQGDAFKGISNPRLKSDLVAKQFQKYEAARHAFAREAAVRPNALAHHQDYKRRLDTLRTSAKPLVDHGQYDVAYKDLAQGGWSENEIAKILNPLSKDTTQQVDKLKIGRTRHVISESSMKQAAQNIQKAEDLLQNVIKPGHPDPKNPNLIEPGTSLILLRNEFQKKGVGFDQFDRMLNRLIASKKVNLDPVQEREREFVTKHPNRVYSIWETLFGPQ